MTIDEVIAVRAQLDAVATALMKAYKAVKPSDLPSSAENVLRFLRGEAVAGVTRREDYL